MNIQFQQWLSITVNHDYFDSGICNVLEFVPTSVTKKIMDRFNFKSNASKNQFSIYYGVNQDSPMAIQDVMKGIEQLTFYIISVDSNFMHYSNLTYPFDPGSVYGFTNEKTGTGNLQSASYVSDADLKICKPMIFPVALPLISEVTLVVKNVSGKPVINQQLNGLNMKTYQVDMTAFGEGFYTVWLNGKQELSCYISGEELPDECIGVIQFSSGNMIDIPANGQLNFSLNFESRSTYWKYSILLAQDRQITIKEMSIKSSAEIEYEGPTKETKIGGVEATVYTSKNPLPLKQKLTSPQSLKIMYYNKFSDRLNDMEFSVPPPDVSQLTITQNNSSEIAFVSSRIIYI